MATNEYEQPAPVPTLSRVTSAAHDLTGTDTRLTLRLLVALLAIGLAGSTAPVPFNLIVAVALVVTVVEVARLAWRR